MLQLVGGEASGAPCAPGDPVRRCLLFVLASWVVITSAASAQGVEVSRASLEDAPVLNGAWRYLPATSVDAGVSVPAESAPWSAWRTVLGLEELPSDWSGAGWFDLELVVAPDAAGALLSLLPLRHNGASRVFLDGELLAEVGQLSLNRDEVVPRTRHAPIVFAAPSPGTHRLTVLFANPDARRYHRVGYAAGFNLRLATAERGAQLSRAAQVWAATQRSLYTSVALAFALLHLLLFVFRREGRANLYFALFSFSLAALVFLLSHKELVADPRIVFWSEGAMNVAGLCFAACGVLFLHRVFGQERSRLVLVLVTVLALVSPWFALWPAQSVAVLFLLMLASLLEMARCVLLAVLRRRPGARIVGVGVLTLVVGFGLGLLTNLGLIPYSQFNAFVAPFASMLVLIVSMSVYLSRRYALTHRELEQQLVRVQELSEQRLAQERRERQQELKTKLLEAEVERKAEELEEARRLQLSMLPQQIPEHPAFEIAAHMTTATEVGGDYYDFEVADDGTLTVAVGDATGHGLKAGTMVTATKSLFNALGGDDDLVRIVSRSNVALKRMNLRNLNMALLLARMEGSRMRVAAAGMPQPLVYRAAERRVEALEIGGMPLGAMARFPYQAVESEIHAGDVVLFMSDGFPERLDPEGSELGYDAVSNAFLEAAQLEVAQIVERLVDVGEGWAAGREADDDVTFVALKRR